LRHDCHFGSLEKDVRGRRSPGLAERPDVPVNFQWSVKHYQLKVAARLGVGFHFRLHEHRATYLRIETVTRSPESDQVIVLDRDVQVKIGPRVGFTTAKRATEPGRTDTQIGMQHADDADQQIVAKAGIGASSLSG
jgi:hypothetical protein